MAPVDLRNPPEGYELAAWYTFPSLHGPWRPSKVHLRPCRPYLNGTRCGRHQPRSSFSARSDRDFREQAGEAGYCKRCWQGAR